MDDLTERLQADIDYLENAPPDEIRPPHVRARLADLARDLREGSTYTWVEDFREARNAAAHIEAALAGAFDTLSEHVCTVDSVRWSKRASKSMPGTTIEGVATFRKRVEGRERAPVDMGAVLIARACMDEGFQARYHAAIRAEYEAARDELEVDEEQAKAA